MTKNNKIYIFLLLINFITLILTNHINMMLFLIINLFSWIIGYIILILIKHKKILYYDKELFYKYLLFYLINYFILFIFKIFSLSKIAIIIDLIVLLSLVIYKNKIRNVSSYITIFILIDYSLCISLLNTNSPIANQLSYMDSAVFRYIGINIKNGLVPYRDIFDHKGILLYFINYIAAIIDENIGIWFINIISNFASLVFSYKLAKIFSNRIISILSVLLSFCILSFICSGGNYVEQYSILFMVISLYLFFKDLKKYNYVKYLSTFIIGACFSNVFLLRPNMVVLWICMSIYLLIKYIYDKKYLHLIKSIILFLLGIIIIIFPFYIYLVSNNAINDFIYDYFIFNFNYNANHVASNLPNVLITFLLHSFQMIIISVIGIVYIRKNKNIYFIFSIIYMILSFIIVIIPRNDYVHYLFVMIPTYIVPFAIIINNYKKSILIFSYILIFISIVIFGKLIPTFNQITTNVDNKLENINKTIQKYSTKDNDVLFYGNNAIYYIITNRKSPNKYLYQTSIIIDKKLYNDFINEMNKKPPKVIIIIDNLSFDNYTSLFNNLNHKYKYQESNSNISFYYLTE